MENIQRKKTEKDSGTTIREYLKKLYNDGDPRWRVEKERLEK